VYGYIILGKWLFHVTLQLASLPVDCAKELFKSLKGTASFQVCNEEQIFGFKFFVSEVGF